MAQFPNSLPTDAANTLSADWLLAFAAVCDGAEQSSDYASAAALVRATISDIAANGALPSLRSRKGKGGRTRVRTIGALPVPSCFVIAMRRDSALAARISSGALSD